MSWEGRLREGEIYVRVLLVPRLCLGLGFGHEWRWWKIEFARGCCGRVAG